MKTALVTGANRGIGFEIARRLCFAGFRVIACGRDREKIEQAVGMLKGEGHTVVPRVLDVADEESIASLARDLESEDIVLDALVNNAAILLDRELDILECTRETFMKSLETNSIAPFLVTKSLLDRLRAGSRVVMMSSDRGKYCDDFSEWVPAYSLSKIALNVITRQLARVLEPKGILINAVCPGWVQTAMGGDGAQRSVEKGAETPVWLATEVEESGKFWRDKQEFGW